MSVDYQEFTTRDMPREDRERLGVGDIWRNAAVCMRCMTTIRSKNRHDFVSCRCGDISVDGGSWYLRRATATDARWEDRSEMYDDAVSR